MHVFVPFHCLVEIKISDASGAEMVLLMRHFAVVSFAGCWSPDNNGVVKSITSNRELDSMCFNFLGSSLRNYYAPVGYFVIGGYFVPWYEKNCVGARGHAFPTR